MIAKLRGTVDATGEDWVIIDVAGIGYRLSCSARTLRRLPPPGGPASVLTELRLRDEQFHLYGFCDATERDWFRLLQTVQGVGARMALGILSVNEPDALATVIAAQDRAPLVQAPGVGPKVAGRILSQLQDAAPVPGTAAAAAAGADDGGPTGEAISALVNLGYGRSEAFRAVAGAARKLGDDADTSELVRAGLRELAP